MNGRPRGIRPYEARPTSVGTGSDSRPVTVDGTAVCSVREEWLVEDSWWSNRRIRRHYFELVLEDGRNVTLFRALPEGGWFSQRT